MEDHRKHMKRTGSSRLWWALKHSVAGIRAGYTEPAFRLEVWLASLMLPASFWLGDTWGEISLLAGTVIVVLAAELLNTAIEAAVDMFTLEWHSMAKRAKDTGSAAVFLAMLWCGGTWIGAIASKWGWW